MKSITLNKAFYKIIVLTFCIYNLLGIYVTVLNNRSSIMQSTHNILIKTTIML